MKNNTTTSRLAEQPPTASTLRVQNVVLFFSLCFRRPLMIKRLGCFKSKNVLQLSNSQNNHIPLHWAIYKIKLILAANESYTASLEYLRPSSLINSNWAWSYSSSFIKYATPILKFKLMTNFLFQLMNMWFYYSFMCLNL